jgi:hypothetical protein
MEKQPTDNKASQVICEVCKKVIIDPSYIEEYLKWCDDCTAKEEEENP